MVMAQEDTFEIYTNETDVTPKKLPSYEELERLTDPTAYIAEEGLLNAVNVALMLGQPLLVTGEPGTGKTQLAYSVAHKLYLTAPSVFLPEPFVFNTKSTSTAKDLFYRYDALAHFHAATFDRDNKPDASKFITFEALGLAILLTLSPTDVDKFLPNEFKEITPRPRRSVVLIDEIDKAPRDLPNDVLDRFEKMRFEVTETGQEFTASNNNRPVLILTSNSEKNLPDAFLRRCVFYHINFPDVHSLMNIVHHRLKLESSFTEEMLSNAITFFQNIRELPLAKKPATAELLAWLRVLGKKNLNVKDAARAKEIGYTYGTLVKAEEDLERLRNTPIELLNKESTPPEI